MRISHECVSSGQGVISIELGRSDYGASVEKSLRTYRQKATLPGFRAGMTPMSVLRKRFGRQVLIDEVNRLVADGLNRYIEESGLFIFGNPVITEESSQVDFEYTEDFRLVFDIALVPPVSVTLTKADVLPYYDIIIDDALVDNQIQAILHEHGGYEVVDEASATDLIRGVVTELEEGVSKLGGIVSVDAALIPEYLHDKSQTSKFVGSHVGDVVVFNPWLAVDGAEAELASFLKVDRSRVPELTGDFSFAISEISRFRPAELGMELYTKIFGEGVTNEVDFRAQMREALGGHLNPRSEYKFEADARALLLKKASDLEIAEDIVKRWLLTRDASNTPEKIEAEMPLIIGNIKFRTVVQHLAKEYGLSATADEMRDYARGCVQSQLRQCGVPSVPVDIFESYVDNHISRTSPSELAQGVMEVKVVYSLRDRVTIEPHSVTYAEFENLYYNTA